MNYKLLNRVFEIQNPSGNRACNKATVATIKSLAPPDCRVIERGGNLLIERGDRKKIRPFYLAHMDQVHDYQPFMTLHRKKGILTAKDGNGEQCGVGGDDKCGIYLAIDMLWRLDHVSAVFVRDEEIGCLGSAVVPLSWFDRAAFVIQADRNNGTMDIIRDTNGMLCASDDFLDEMLSLPAAIRAGHDESCGSITDIGELAQRGLAVSMVNISSGYHHPHSRREHVVIAELEIACDLAFQAAQRLGSERWHHIPTYAYRAPMGNNVDWCKWIDPLTEGADDNFGSWADEDESNDWRLAL